MKTPKSQLIADLSVVLSCRVEDVKPFDKFTISELKKIKRVMQAAIDRAHEE